MLTAPPVLLGALLLLLSSLALLRSGPPAPAGRVQVETLAAEDERRSEEVQLVAFELGPSDTWLEQPHFAQVVSGTGASARYAAILAAFRENLSALWPPDLPLPTVIAVGEGGAGETVVLDFAIPERLPVSVMEEERLLRSLRATLGQNGAARVRILVNNRPSVTFLGHVRLEQSLE